MSKGIKILNPLPHSALHTTLKTAQRYVARGCAELITAKNGGQVLRFKSDHRLNEIARRSHAESARAGEALMFSGRAIRSQETSPVTRGSGLPGGAPGVVLRPCAKQPCTALVESGRCPAHRGVADQVRGTSSERGYDAVWQRFRSWYLARHPLCMDCEAAGLLTVAAFEVHHVKKLADHPELRLVEENCMGLCSPCHAVRTRRGE